MAAFHLTLRTAVRGYYVYKEVWVRTVDEEFDCWHEADNREDRYAVTVYGDTQSSTCMYSAWTSSSNFARILNSCCWSTMVLVSLIHVVGAHMVQSQVKKKPEIRHD